MQSIKHTNATFDRSIWILLLLTFMCYIPSIFCGFIWDDFTFILQNPIITSDPHGLQKIWISKELLDYWPISYTIQWINFHLFSSNPAGYHIVNILIHLGTVLFLYKILDSLSFKGAFWASALFALHPVNVESVTWIFQIKSTTAVLCAFAAVFFYIKAINKSKSLFWGLSLVLFLIGLLSKTSIVCLPLMLATIDWLLCHELKKTLQRIWPFFLIAIGVGGLSLWFNLFRSLGGTALGPSIIDKILNIGPIFWFYAFKAIAPFHLSFVYPKWSLHGSLLLQVILLALLPTTLLLLYFFRKKFGNIPLWTFLWYSLALVPVLGLIDIFFFNFSFVADHYQYFGLPALCVLAVYCVKRLVKKGNIQRGFLIALTTAFAITTIHAQGKYVNEKTLWNDTLRKNPNAWIAHNNLANILINKENKADSAIIHYKKALELHSSNNEAIFNLGATYLSKNNPSEAIPYFQKSLLGVYETQAKYYLGQSYVLTNQDFLAVPLFKELLLKNKNNSELYYWLSQAYLKQGDTASSLSSLDSVLRIDPAGQNGYIWFLRSDLLANSGKFDEAIRSYILTIQRSPNNPLVYNNLGVVYGKIDSLDKALECYQKAIALAPDFRPGFENISEIYSAQGNKKMAAEYRKKAEALPKFQE